MRSVAVIENNKVVNVVVVADGKKGDEEISRLKGIDITGRHIGPGWSYLDGEFHAPEPSAEELEQIEAMKQRQLNIESAKSKLAALGLSDDEISALVRI